MARWNRWLVIAAMLGWMLLLARPAPAVAPLVRDQAKFFSVDAVKKANDQLRELYQQHGRDFLIETYETVPKEQIEKVKAMSREERTKFFETWAKARVQQRVVNGVYLLICKDPSMFWLEVGGKGRSLDPSAREKLREQVISDLRAKRYDDGLTNAVKFVKEKLSEAK